MDLMLQQLAMANLYLDTAAITGIEQEPKTLHRESDEGPR